MVNLFFLPFGMMLTRHGKSFLPTCWDDANATALKAYEALSVDDLSPLMAKSSSEVMSSHIQKIV